MFHHSIRSSVACRTLALLGLVTFSAVPSGAQTLNYDPNHASDVWDTTTANWSGSVWTPGANAVFGGTGEIVDVDGNITVNHMTFNSSGYEITDTAAIPGTLTLANGSIITVTNAADLATISEILGGVSWVKAGDGTLFLTGENTFTGGVTINAGTLKIGHAFALGAGGGSNVLAVGGTLDLNGFTLDNETFLTFQGTLTNTGATEGVITAQVGPASGTQTPVNVVGSGNIRLSNADRIHIIKSGTGILTLDGTDDNNAMILTVNEGTVYLAKSAGGVRAVGSGLTINDGLVRLTGNGGDQIYLGVSPTINGGLLDLNGRNESINAINGTGGRVVNDAASTTSTLSVGEGNSAGTYHGVIADNSGTGGILALTKVGRGVQTLTNQQTYTGLTAVSNGGLTLDFAHTSGSAAQSNIINAVSALRLSNSTATGLSTFTILGESGGTNSQTVSKLDITAGRVRMILTPGSGGTVDLNVGALTYTNTAYVDFVLPTGSNINTTSANSILGPRATFGYGASYAQILGGKVVAFEGDLVYVTDTNIGSLPSYSATGNLRVDGTSVGNVIQATSGSPLQLNTIQFQDTESRVMLIGAGNTLQLGATGGILRSVNAGTVTIGAEPGVGSLTTGTASGADLIFTNANAAGSLIVNSVLKNNAGGALDVVVNGATNAVTVFNAANTYTGTTVVQSGVLRVTNNTALGTTAAGTVLGEGAVLELSGNINIGTEALTIWGSGVSNGGALRNVSGNNSYGGVITLSGGSRIASDSGMLMLDSNAATGIAAGNNELMFFGAGDIVVVDGITQGGSNNNSVIKDGTGTLTLAGSNTFTGTGVFLIRNGGKVVIQHNNALGGTAAGTTIAASSSLELRNNITVNEVIIIDNSQGVAGTGAIRNGSGTNTLSGTVTVDNGNARITSDTGTLTFNNATTAIQGDPTANSARTVFFDGAGDFVVGGGGIKDGAGSGSALSVTKEGAGVLTLGASNTYTGATTVNRGTLRLNYDTGAGGTNTSKLANAAVLTLGGGTVELVGGSHTEVVASTTLTAGTKNFVTRTSGTSVLQMNTITVGAGASVNFSAANIASTDNLNVNGILGGWATINGTDWAMNSTNAADGLITAYTGYTDITRMGSTIADSGASNVRIVEPGSTSGDIALSGAAGSTTNINTLVMSAVGTVAPITQPAVIDTTGKTLRLGTAGGVMVASGANGLTFGTAVNAGTLTAGGTAANTAGAINFINNNTLNSVVVNSVIANNGSGVVNVVKDGAGTLVLNGDNTFTGGVSANGGILRATGFANALGSGGTLTLTNTELQLANDTGLDFNRATILGSDTAIVIDRLTAGAGVTHMLDAITFNGNYTLSVVKGSNITSGVAGLTFDGRLSNNSASTTPVHTNFYTGTDVVLTILGSVNANPTQFGNINKSGNGTLVLGGSNTYWEGISVNLTGGTLDIRQPSTLGDDNPVNGPIYASSGTTVRLTNDAATNFQSPLTLIGPGGTVDLVVDRVNDGAAVNHSLDNLNLAGSTLNVSAGSRVTSGRAQMTFTGASTVGLGSRINATTADVVINNVLSGDAGSLEKLGAGALTLLGANTYTGGTTVSQGVVYANNTTGSATGSGDVRITGTSILAGTGTVGLDTASQDITVESLAILRVGASTGVNTGGAQDLALSTSGVGVISLLGTVEFDIFGNAGGVNPISNNDLLRLASDTDVTISGTLVVKDVTNTSGTWVSGTSWQIFDWSSVTTPGNYGGAGFTAFDLPTLNAALYAWDTSNLYTAGTIGIIAVPEPSRVILLGLGLIVLWGRRRRA